MLATHRKMRYSPRKRKHGVNTIADKEITVGGYIDTVLMRHFEENKDEINNLYRRNRDNLI